MNHNPKKPMTPKEFLHEFSSPAHPQTFRVENYPLYLMLRKPAFLDYIVSGLLDRNDRKLLQKRRYFGLSRRLRKPHVTDSFRYEMWGIAGGIEGRFEQNCRLYVNSSGVLHERCKSSATIGWGRYTGQEFLLYLGVSSEVAKNIIMQRVLAPNVEVGLPNKDEDDASETWMRMTLTIFGAYERQAIPDVSFSIGSAYVSSVFSPLQFT